MGRMGPGENKRTWQIEAEPMRRMEEMAAVHVRVLWGGEGVGRVGEGREGGVGSGGGGGGGGGGEEGCTGCACEAQKPAAPLPPLQ